MRRCTSGYAAHVHFGSPHNQARSIFGIILGPSIDESSMLRILPTLISSNCVASDADNCLYVADQQDKMREPVWRMGGFVSPLLASLVPKASLQIAGKVLLGLTNAFAGC